jgi:TonB family protein
MSVRSFFLLPFALLCFLFSWRLVAAQVPTETDAQKRAEALIGTAQQLSDIRSSASAPFRLTATFTFAAESLETLSGTYTEVWVSKSQWRREIDVGTSQQIEIAASGKYWVIDKPEDFPERARPVLGLMLGIPNGATKLQFESISDRTEGNVEASCAVTKAGSRHERLAYCFEKKTGVLVESVLPRIRSTNVVDYACSFATFRKFGDHWFPREMSCFEDRHKMIEAKVTDIVAEPSPDPGLFTQPAGAIELGFCSGTATPSVNESAPLPIRPLGAPRDVNARVELAFVIDAKGRTQDIRAVKPGQKAFDQAAIDAVRGWKFKPATCNGVPMATRINVEVPFRTLF